MQAIILATSLLLSILTLGVIDPRRGEPIRVTAPSLNGATGWLNSRPLRLNNLRGKVVLIDFWAYTCINWRRTLPYLRAWQEKYRDLGLVVVGVHTPEFSFEYDQANVQRSIKEMNITYPVAIDNEYAIWESFNNRYWPALYLLDAKGRSRFQKFGEGDYLEIEKQIQQLLRESTGRNISSNTVNVHQAGVEAAPDWANMASPETFLGYDRTEGFASPNGVIPDTRTAYSAPRQLKLNQWALSGEWVMKDEYVVSTKEKVRINYRFHSRDLHLIMGPSRQGRSIKFRVLIDGRPPGASHGLDIDSEGFGIVKDQRMYQLIRQQGSIRESEFQIEFLDAHVEVFDFTFG